MVDEKNLDPKAADMIGQYVVHKGLVYLAFHRDKNSYLYPSFTFTLHLYLPEGIMEKKYFFFYHGGDKT